MTVAYHGTPITPRKVLDALCWHESDEGEIVKSDRSFCVSYWRPDQAQIVAEQASSFFIDNGAFSAWRKGVDLSPAYWAAFYAWLPAWLAAPTTWFVIPDVIDAGSQLQDAMIRECPAELIGRGWPVWHMDEPISRLLRLIEQFGRVCIGSTAEYAVIGSPAWRELMDEAFNNIEATFGTLPPVHMLRGLQCLLPTFDYPLTSVDSTNLARNHNRMKRYGERRIWATVEMANRWDRLNCPTTWPPDRLRVQSLFAA